MQKKYTLGQELLKMNKISDWKVVYIYTQKNKEQEFK